MHGRIKNSDNHMVDLLANLPEIFMYMLSFCDDKDLFNLMLTSKSFIPFCQNDKLWQDQLKRKFPLENYYPKYLDQIDGSITPFSIFKNHLLYATYDFVSLWFDDQNMKLSVNRLTPHWRAKEKAILGPPQSVPAKMTDNIHPLFKEGIGCQSYESCLNFLVAIQSNPSCQKFIHDKEVIIILPNAFNNFKGRSVESCTIERMIEYIRNRMEAKPDSFLPEKRHDSSRKAGCTLS